MKENNLENFVRQNRKDFDTRRPPRGLWDAVEKELDKKKEAKGGGRRISLWRVLQVAAAAVILLAAGAYLGIRSTVPASSNMAVIEEIYPEFPETKAYYESEVNNKIAQLAKYDYDPSINDDLLQLDEFLQELKDEIEDAPKGAQEQIVENIIRNYQYKLDILERVLDRIQSTNQKTEKSKYNDTSI